MARALRSFGTMSAKNPTLAACEKRVNKRFDCLVVPRRQTNGRPDDGHDAHEESVEDVSPKQTEDRREGDREETVSKDADALK